MNLLSDFSASWLRRIVGGAVPLLLVAGGVSAALVSGDGSGNGGADSTSVAALQAPNAPGAAGGDVAEATAVPTPSPSTTAPARPAAATFEPPPVTEAAPATTRPTTPPTTVARPTTTTTTIPAGAVLVTFVNEFPDAVTVQVNGVQYSLAAGQRLVDQVVFPGNAANEYHDSIGIRWVAKPGCGVGDAMPYFQGAQRFTFTVITGTGRCMPENLPGPDFRITPR